MERHTTLEQEREVHTYLKQLAEEVLFLHNADDILKEPVFTDILKNTARLFPQYLAGTIVAARVEKKTDSSIVALVILRDYRPDIFREIFPMVILSTQDLIKFTNTLKTLGKGFGRAVKKAIANYLKDNLTEKDAILYREELADIIMRCHIKGNNTLLDYIVGHVKQLPEEYLIEIYKKHQLIGTYEALIYFLKQGREDDARAIIESGLLDDELVEKALQHIR